jgi:hypothetical protein
MLNQLFVCRETHGKPSVVQVVGFPEPGDWRKVSVRAIRVTREKSKYSIAADGLNQWSQNVAMPWDPIFEVSFSTDIDAYVIRGVEPGNDKLREYVPVQLEPNRWYNV